MRQIRAGIDVDGVLADFTRGYLSVLKEASGGKECDLHRTHGEPDCWYWAEKYGYSKGEDNKAWELIKSHPTFWLSLPAYLETRAAVEVLANIYAEGHEVYFITNRPGIATHAQTCAWLMNQGFPMPTVLVTEDKGPVVKGLKLNFMIDDKPQNCWDIMQAVTPKDINVPRTCRVFMLSKPWNTDPKIRMKCEFLGVEIVGTLKEFFEVLAKEENVDAVAN